MIYSMYIKQEGTWFPKGLKLVQTNNETIIQYVQLVWQPSLVLGGLERARDGPYSPQKL
jgi:hypothetical protein